VPSFGMAYPRPVQGGKGATVPHKANQLNDVKYELVAESAADFPSEPPLRLIQRVLRGRWILVAILAIAMAVIAGTLGYNAVPPKFESTALVRIESTLPSILYNSTEKLLPPNFEAYVASHVNYLQSREVLDAAVSTPEMQAVGWPQGARGVASLEGSLNVYRRRGEQVISVSVLHTDPYMAQVAANAVIDAYVDVCGRVGRVNLPETLQTLEQRETDLSQQLVGYRAQMLEVSNEYGSPAVQRMHTNKVEELIAIDRKIADLQIARARIASGEASDIPATTALSPEETRLAALRDKELSLRAEIAGLRNRFGDKHPLVRELSRQLDTLLIEIDMRLNAGTQIASSTTSSSIDPLATNEASLATIDRHLEQYKVIREQLREETASLGRQSVLLTGLSEKIDETRDLLTATRRRLDEVRVESKTDDLNRISIASRADYPVVPTSDRRRGLAAAGVIFGVLTGTSIVFLLGLVDTRLRFAEEYEVLDLEAPLVAMLPRLGGSAEDEDRAARSIHQLRNLIAVQSFQNDHKIIAVTSPDQGEGKTSVALALATSFAAAGHETLLIDTDIRRHRLSIELGLIDQPGLREALGSDTDSGQAHRMTDQPLWVMPVGTSEDIEAEDLSRDKLQWLLSAVRDRFDAIVLDTGSILTSVEASVATASADQVLLVVARDQKRPIVETAFDRMDQVGANCLGVVFNMADASDIARGESARRHRRSRIASLVREDSSASHSSTEARRLTMALEHAHGKKTPSAESEVNETRRAA
jgi:succinoglycan biosynthesis transport protein ExoP